MTYLFLIISIVYLLFIIILCDIIYIMKKIIYLSIFFSFIILGCRKKCNDPAAVNYNGLAAKDLGVCVYIPKITTLSAINITDTSARINGLVQFEDEPSIQGPYVRYVGFHLSEGPFNWGVGPVSSLPLTHYIQVSNNDIDTFYFDAYNLNSNTTYYFQAFCDFQIYSDEDTTVNNYATLSSPINGEEVTFTTN